MGRRALTVILVAMAAARTHGQREFQPVHGLGGFLAGLIRTSTLKLYKISLFSVAVLRRVQRAAVE